MRGHRVAPDAANHCRVGLDRKAAVGDRDGGPSERDGAADRHAETVMLADEAVRVEGETPCLCLVAEPKRTKIEAPRLKRTATRRGMRLNRTVGVPQPRRWRIEVAPGIGDPILAVDRELDRELVVVGVRAAPA